MDKFHETADAPTRDAMLACFLLGRDAQQVQLGKKFFDDANRHQQSRKNSSAAARRRVSAKRRAKQIRDEYENLKSLGLSNRSVAHHIANNLKARHISVSVRTVQRHLPHSPRQK